MKVTAALLLSAAALANAVQLEIKPFKRLIPADVLRGGNHLYLDIYSDLANICHLLWHFHVCLLTSDQSMTANC